VPVVVAAEAVELAAARKPPKAVKERQPKAVEVNDQTPYFE
jgi:hypothetical protein